jgi:hypothetical protein
MMNNHMGKKELLNLLADMVFAYTNKDDENPHDFETNTIIRTCELLKKEYMGTKYTDHFFNCILDKLKGDKSC